MAWHALRRAAARAARAAADAVHVAACAPASSGGGGAPSPLRTAAARAYAAAKRGRRKVSAGVQTGGATRDRDAALAAAMQQLEANFGAGAVMRLGDQGSNADAIDAVSTGSLLLDRALGVGGLPKGRVVEIYGPEASGKTTLALHAVAAAQAAGGNAVFVDAEHALDTRYASKLGCDVGALVVAQPDTGEQALEVVDTFVRSASVDVVVVDSVAALVPRAELEGEMGDAHMALQARLMSQALRKLTHSLARSNTLIIFLNQIRSKVNTFGYGPNEVTAGGNALKYYSSVRLDIRRIGSVKGKGDEVVGSQVRIKVAKNKLAPPFKTVELEIDFGRGLSWEAELIDVAAKHGIVAKAGAFFKYKDQVIGQGKEAAKRRLREDEVRQPRILSLYLAPLHRPRSGATLTRSAGASSAAGTRG